MAEIMYPLVKQGDIFYHLRSNNFVVVADIDKDGVVLRGGDSMPDFEQNRGTDDTSFDGYGTDFALCKTRQQIQDILLRNALDPEVVNPKGISLQELDYVLTNEELPIVPFDKVESVESGAIEQYLIPTSYRKGGMNAIEIDTNTYEVKRFKYDKGEDDESKQQDQPQQRPQEDQPQQQPQTDQPQQQSQPSAGNMLARFWNWVMRKDNGKVSDEERVQVEQGVKKVEEAWGKKNWATIATVLVGGGLALLYKLYTRWKESPDAQVQNPASDSSESSDNDLLQPEDRTSYPDQLRAMETFDARVNRRLTDLGFNRPSYSDRKSMLMKVVEAIGARQGVNLNDTSVVQQILREELDLANDYETASEQLKRSERFSMLLRKAFAAEFPLINWAEVVT